MSRFSVIVTKIAFAAALLSPATAFALDGSWRGELAMGAAKLPLVFNFSEDAEQNTLCTLDSPAQGAKGIPAPVVYISTDSLSLTVSSIGAKYNARISATEIIGTFSQGPYSFPLTLTPELSLSERRPQTPRPPYPYTTLDTTFTATDGVTLAGTLTIPAGGLRADMPALVMVSGSGPQNRDEELFDHRPFAVIADYLGREGIATFRYDDRGVAQSGGDFGSSDFNTFAADAAAAMRMLRGVEGIGKVGVLGHSEGGTIAMRLASATDADLHPDFIISLAGVAEPAKATLLRQNRDRLMQLNLSSQEVDDLMCVIEGCFDALIAGESEIDVDAIANKAGLSPNPMVMAELRRNLPAMSTPAFLTMLRLRPDEWLDNIHVPMLALNGSLDTQVNPEANLNLITSHIPSATAIELPGLNHLLQPATTGDITEYESIPQTISPEALAAILTFLRP